MHNPNSAIERVKNHLAYKLGQAMIDFTNSSSGGRYIALFKKLYKIKEQHKKEQKIYQQTIQVFPQLKYPSLEACSDYEQALRYKFHLSYMLGEVLIKAYQTWYTGGGFKLKNNIKKANKEFQIFREIFKEFDQINSSILEGLIDNKQLFLKEFSRIKNILKIHQDYKAILDNIFHNFNYFIQNFDLIEEWLLSDDFKERYKKENHPYPSLLDPKKLNDKNEKINYHNIPAELAWEMNLPLPRNKIVYIGYGLSGNAAMLFYLSKYNKVTTNYMQSYNSNYIFNINYQFNKDILVNFKKIHLLYENKAIVLTRDPIERIVTAINHGYWKNLNQKDFDLISVDDDIDKVLDRIRYVKKHDMKNNHIEWSDVPTLDMIDNILDNHCFKYNTILKKSNLAINYVDMKQISEEYAFETLQGLAEKFKLTQPNEADRHIISMKQNNIFRYLLPLVLRINKIDIFIIGSSLHVSPRYKIINHLVLDFDNTFYDLLFIAINKEQMLSNDLIIFLKQYMFNFTIALDKKVKFLQSNLLSKEKCIDYLKNKKEIRKKLKKILDEELVHIKQHRPDIVASWKYYQEFEKMCEELNDDIQEKGF
ncbi:DUF2972 domain-containing protein [Campylobacter jejuni]|nr:DUF2972 domain-containing protein [Campylobacter jejuni]EAK0972657.1 DUF2972 domain-containing protein [Campylobacter jejuni]